MGVEAGKVCGYDPQTVFFAIGYCMASSLLSIINKFAVKVFPYPSSLTGLQYATSAGAVFLFGVLGLIDKVDACTWSTVTTMTPVVLTFCGSVFCNMKVLQHANVETFIVLRSTTPLVVAVVDGIFRPYAAVFPSPKTWVSLLLILLGAVGYVYVDSEFSIDSYMWGAAYIFFFVVEMVWVKDIMTKVKISNWGLVFYNNFGSLFISIVMAVLTDEGSAATWLFGLGRSRHSHVDGGAGGHRMLLGGGGRALEEAPKADWVLDSRNTAAEAISARANIAGGDGVIGKSAGVVSLAGEFSMLRSHHNYVPLMAVSLSCLFGLGISFFGFAIRRRISATGFTVMGCTNKLLTLLVNTLVWTHHASLPAQGCVLISIAGGVLYGEFSKADADMKKIGGGKAVLPMGKSEGGIPVSVKAGAGADRGGASPSGDHPSGGGGRTVR